MKQYKILGQMKMEKLEEELNRLADDGWRVSVLYPYQFKEQLKLFILLEKERNFLRHERRHEHGRRVSSDQVVASFDCSCRQDKRAFPLSALRDRRIFLPRTLLRPLRERTGLIR